MPRPQTLPRSARARPGARSPPAAYFLGS